MGALRAGSLSATSEALASFRDCHAFKVHYFSPLLMREDFAGAPRLFEGLLSKQRSQRRDQKDNFLQSAHACRSRLAEGNVRKLDVLFVL